LPPSLSDLTTILDELNETGRVSASIIATDEGFVIASAVRPGVNEQVAAAMGSFVHQAAERARKEMGLGTLRDVIIRCTEGTLVCKAAQASGGHRVILAALIRPEHRFFLRPINTAVRKLRDALKRLRL